MQLYLSRKEQYAVVVLLLAIIGALFVLSYAYGKRTRENDNQPFFVQSAGASGTPGAAADAATATDVVVHVAGAVNKPGVYNLPAGGRINDAVQLAGGPRADSDADALNLAEKLQDGERIYVPTRTESQKITLAQGPPELITRDPSTPLASTSKATSATRTKPPVNAATPAKANTATKGAPAAQPAHRGPKELPKEPISINSATLEQLQGLPCVGVSTAQKILDYRKEHGKFFDPTQLLGVGGIGPKKFEKMAPYIKL